MRIRISGAPLGLSWLSVSRDQGLAPSLLHTSFWLRGCHAFADRPEEHRPCSVTAKAWGPSLAGMLSGCRHRGRDARPVPRKHGTQPTLPALAGLRALLFAGICWVCLAAAATGADGPASPVLHLANGDFVRGELLGADDPKVLRWRSPFFARPLEFPLSAINAVHYAVAGPQPQPPGEYCFELGDDDVLFGNLLGLTDDQVELDSARIGRVHLRRESIRRLSRWKGADSIYLGPNGLAGWKDSSATPQWRDEGGQLVTDRRGASLFADLGIPEKAVIEVELSWKRKPDFVFALGVGDRDLTPPQAFHLEVWDGELVAVGESARDADLASLAKLGTGEGHVRVQAYLDQAQRRLIVLSRSGKPLATLRIREEEAA